MTLTAGTRLGPYEILSPLGAGGMGEVYKARDTKLGREIAVKVLQGDVAMDPSRRQRFEQEARSASALNHPNILTIHDIAEADGTLYIAMELVEGKTLRELIVSGDPLPTRKLLDIAVQAAEGLAKAHGAGIVHRDLKPENLMVSKDGFVKILDFGLAKLTEPASQDASVMPTAIASPTQPGTVMGTAGYMSPEQASGQPVDFRSDQFSLGSILYEMATGKKAFHRGTGAQTLAAIIQDEPEPISQVNPRTPAPVRWIVERCLAKDPEERYASTKDLARDLRSIRDHLSETSASGAMGVAAPARSRWRAIPLALLGLGLLVGFLARGVLGRRHAVEPPSFRQLTFRHGSISAARFAPDGQTIVYSAAWDGEPFQLYTERLEFPESRPLGYSNAALLSVSAQGEVATILGGARELHLMVRGTVSRLPLSGGAPREILEDVRQADWAPGDKGLAVIHDVAGKDRLELPVGRVVYETAGWISWPRVSPAGERIAFFDHDLRPDDHGSVAVVDLSGKKHTLSVGWETTQGLAWSPDGREVWFTAAKAGIARDLYAVDLEGRQRLLARGAGGVVLQDVFRDGRVLLTRDTERLSIWCLPPGESKERDLSWLEWSLPTDLSPDGTSLLFCEEGLGGGPSYAACLRKTDGSPVVRLGEGYPSEISPDGKWVTSFGQSPNERVLLPTGAGESKKLERGAIQAYMGGASFFPDGKRLLFCAIEAGGPALYVQEISEGKPRRIGDGFFTFSHPISPDGKTLAVYDRQRRIVLIPAEGGTARPLPGFIEGDAVIRWSQDGALFVSHGDIPVDLVRIDVTNGARTLVKRIAPPDPAGVNQLRAFVLTPDGKTYAYGCSRVLSDLYLVEGLK